MVTITGIGQTFHEVFVQCCIACEWHRRMHKKVFAILVDQQVQVLALGEQQQLQQQVQRSQLAAVLIRLTLDTLYEHLR